MKGRHYRQCVVGQGSGYKRARERTKKRVRGEKEGGKKGKENKKAQYALSDICALFAGNHFSNR